MLYVTKVNHVVFLQVLRLDISNINPSDGYKTTLDMAVKVGYSPLNVGHLLVSTSENKLIKFDSRTGRLLAEVFGCIFVLVYL